MIGRWSLSLAATTLAALGLIALAPADAQMGGDFASTQEARAALDSARRQQRNARARGERFERRAEISGKSADKALRQAAALAARIQQAEAGIAAAEAELALISVQRRVLDRRLAEKRGPLVRLTGALAIMARRPITLAALQPGSLRDLVYTRAVLDSTIPQVRARTTGLRGELDRARGLQRSASGVLSSMRDNERSLAARRRELVALAQSERLTARRAAGGATREAALALALAEDARDLDGLVGRLEAAGNLRERLAALPGPIPRPGLPEAARLVSVTPSPSPSATVPSAAYQLPVAGRLVSGFGEARRSGARQTGIVMAPRASAQVVAPGAGRVAFAGAYQGYGRIVIIEHPGGWISLVTGLASLDTAVGRKVTTGSPIGLAERHSPRVMLELRKDGEPVNPLEYAR